MRLTLLDLLCLLAVPCQALPKKDDVDGDSRVTIKDAVLALRWTLAGVPSNTDNRASTWTVTAPHPLPM
jgi:hypothetical protein